MSSQIWLCATEKRHRGPWARLVLSPCYDLNQNIKGRERVSERMEMTSESDHMGEKTLDVFCIPCSEGDMERDFQANLLGNIMTC